MRKPPVTVKWRTTQPEEFRKLGQHVITRCSFCDEIFEGHKDKGSQWYRGHLYNQHRGIYFKQKATPSKLKKKYVKPKEKD